MPPQGPSTGSGQGRLSRCGGRPTTISSLATYVPPRVLTNADLEKMVDTSDEWILQRTGIRERHIVDPGVATSDLGKEAAVRALANAKLSPDDIGVIIVGTVTPDMLFPSTACLIQHKIGARRAWGFDLSAACSAFTYAAHHRQPAGRDRRARARAGRRRRRDVEHHRLQGPVDLCPVRGRGRSRRGLGRQRQRRGDPRLRARSRRQRRIRAVHARRRQSAAGVARDGRRSDALREAGRSDRVPLRGAEDRGDLPAPPGAQRADAAGRRPLRLAPGEPPDYPERQREARTSTRRRSSSTSSDSATRRQRPSRSRSTTRCVPGA